MVPFAQQVRQGTWRIINEDEEMKAVKRREGDINHYYLFTKVAQIGPEGLEEDTVGGVVHDFSASVEPKEAVVRFL